MPGLSLRFDHPEVLYLGAPAVSLALVLFTRRLSRTRLARARRLVLVLSRGIALATLLFLLGGPRSFEVSDLTDRLEVAVLVDRSRSMALADADEGNRERFEKATAYAREELGPALGRKELRMRTFLFDESAVEEALPAPGTEVAEGRRTNLASALLQAVLSVQPAPLVVVVLTDGAANRSESNPAALAALLDSRTPFFGAGFGSDEGVPTLALHRVSAPTRVPPRERFAVTAELQVVTRGERPELDLVLLRDGKFLQAKRVPPAGPKNETTGPRFWSESFEVTEAEEGVHEFTVELRLPASSTFVAARTRASTVVRIGREEEFRVLFVQGALAWDFKFIRLALRGDPQVRLTGLSRTSEHSVFRQDVESAEELAAGFPRHLSEISPYRVVVLSELKPSHLSTEQQELLARFVSELGGGLLVLGGESTFDASWQGSTLEKVLPVTFDSGGGVSGLDRSFRLELTEEAYRSPVFQVTDEGSAREAWAELPAFHGYGRVRSEKPGAVVWARHGEDRGTEGQRILMASQYFGSGIATVIAVQNLWRWRLAKNSVPERFDRFWQQLFRHLGQAGRPEVYVQLADQELRTGADVRVLVERIARPESGAAAAEYSVQIQAPSGARVLERNLELSFLRPVEVIFRSEEEGIYTVSVASPRGAHISRPIEIRDGDVEMERTERDMAALTQWAELSEGLAFRAEELPSGEEFVARMHRQLESRRLERRARPVGVNGLVLALVLAALGTEWLGRRKWSLT